MLRSILCLVCIFLLIRDAKPLYCEVGYGQRGKLTENGILWHRECPGATYCFEAFTDSVVKARKLIDYQWVSSLRKYALQSFLYLCGIFTRIRIIECFTLNRAEVIMTLLKTITHSEGIQIYGGNILVNLLRLT